MVPKRPIDSSRSYGHRPNDEFESTIFVSAKDLDLSQPLGHLDANQAWNIQKKCLQGPVVVYNSIGAQFKTSMECHNRFSRMIGTTRAGRAGGAPCVKQSTGCSAAGGFCSSFCPLGATQPITSSHPRRELMPRRRPQQKGRHESAIMWIRPLDATAFCAYHNGKKTVETIPYRKNKNRKTWLLGNLKIIESPKHH